MKTRKGSSIKQLKRRGNTRYKRYLLTQALKKMKKKWRETNADPKRARIDTVAEMLSKDSLESPTKVREAAKEAEALLKREIEEGDIWINPKTGEVMRAKPKVLLL